MHLRYAFHIKFQVIPGLGIGDHIPAQGIRTIFLHHHKWIHGIVEALRHLIAFLVEHQAVGNNGFIGDRIEEHHGNGVEGKEPATGLVHSFGNEIRRKIIIQIILVFKRIMELGIGHCA